MNAISRSSFPRSYARAKMYKLFERSQLAIPRLARLDLLAFFRAKQFRRRKRLLLVYFMKKNHANEENESYQISYQ